MQALVRGIAAAALAVGLVGGLAGVAQAQQHIGVDSHTQVVPRHDGREIEAVQPNTRDMSVRPNCGGGWYELTGEGVRIRATPGGTILALAYTSDDYQIYYYAYGNTFYMSDMTRHVTGYIAAAYVDYVAPTCTQ
jgi:hypothetical protein